MDALGWFRWTGRNPKTEQMRHLYGLLERMEAIAYAPDGEKDNPSATISRSSRNASTSSGCGLPPCVMSCV